MRRRLPSLSPPTQRALPWLALLALEASPAVALTRAWATVLLAWSLQCWAHALADCPDGAGLRRVYPATLRAFAPTSRWTVAVVAALGVLLGLYTQGKSDVGITAMGYVGAWAAYAYARHAQRTQLGAAEILSYAAGLLCVAAPALVVLHGSAASHVASAALAFTLRFGALWFSSLEPATTLKLAAAQRLVFTSAVSASFIALCTYMLATTAGASPLWSVPYVLFAFSLGLRLPKVSRIFLPQAGARLAFFERSLDAPGESSAQTLAHMLEVLTEAADAGDGARLHLANEDWDQETFAFLGTFPFAVVSTGTLAHLSKRRPELRSWLHRLQREEACAWLRLGTVDQPMGYLSVPEAYAGGALCYEEVRVLHQLGLRMAQRIVESSALKESSARHLRAQAEQAALREELQSTRAHSEALTLAAHGALAPALPLSYYSGAATELVRSLASPLRAQPADLVLPPGVPVERLLAGTQERWYLVHATRFADAVFAAQWTALRAALQPTAVAVVDAHLLSVHEHTPIDADVYVYPTRDAPQASAHMRLTLPDLQDRPEDIESTILDELVQAGLANFGSAVGADDRARAYLVELAHAHGEALLRATIRRAVCALSTPRPLTLGDM